MLIAIIIAVIIALIMSNIGSTVPPFLNENTLDKTNAKKITDIEMGEMIYSMDIYAQEYLLFAQKGNRTC